MTSNQEQNIGYKLCPVLQGPCGVPKHYHFYLKTAKGLPDAGAKRRLKEGIRKVKPAPKMEECMVENCTIPTHYHKTHDDDSVEDNFSDVDNEASDNQSDDVDYEKIHIEEGQTSVVCARSTAFINSTGIEPKVHRSKFEGSNTVSKIDKCHSGCPKTMLGNKNGDIQDVSYFTPAPNNTPELNSIGFGPNELVDVELERYFDKHNVKIYCNSIGRPIHDSILHRVMRTLDGVLSRVMSHTVHVPEPQNLLNITSVSRGIFTPQRVPFSIMVGTVYEYERSATVYSWLAAKLSNKMAVANFSILRPDGSYNTAINVYVQHEAAHIIIPSGRKFVDLIDPGHDLVYQDTLCYVVNMIVLKDARLNSGNGVSRSQRPAFQ